MSLSAFWPILRKRQVQVVIVASVVAGLRIGLPLALILLVEEQAGDFASAGAVAGAFTLASALSGPPKGRVIDRRGQPRVLVPLAVASALGLVALVLAARSDASVVALITLATLAGLTTAPLLTGIELAGVLAFAATSASRGWRARGRLDRRPGEPRHPDADRGEPPVRCGLRASRRGDPGVRGVARRGGGGRRDLRGIRRREHAGRGRLRGAVLGRL
jgi:hypothetical protein